jgi:lysophospholipase L1-like esterase
VTPVGRRFTAALVVTLLSLAATSCSGRARRVAAPAATPSTPSRVYVALGGSDTVGTGAQDQLRDAWPQVFFRTALPLDTVFVNLAIPGATTDDLLAKEVPNAEALSPNLVTVWANVEDLLAGTPADVYEQRLAEIVRRLRRGGATKVFVAVPPAVDQLPGVLACEPAPPPGAAPCRLLAPPPPTDALALAVVAYRSITQRVAAAEGAVVVDVPDDGGARDGLHPDTAGHRRVADAFASALRASGGL